MQMEGWTDRHDMTKLTLAFPNFANQTGNEDFSLLGHDAVLTHCYTQLAVRRAQPSMPLLLILAFCQ